MERTEPTLVPEWLRCTRNVSGSGASLHHSVVSSSVCSKRSRSFRSNNTEKDSTHYLDRSSSFNSRHNSSSNGSAKHPYSSFSNSRHGDKNRDREKEKSLPKYIWDYDSSDPLGSILTNRADRSALKRSQSLNSRKSGETRTSANNGVLSGSSNLNVIRKEVFEKDFPSLGTEEQQNVTGIKRVLSPGLSSSTVQNLPIGNSGFLGGEKWTSALAEVPRIHSTGVSNTTGLNMAEALSQPAAAQVLVTPQLPDKSLRLEELAIKQSRQLIPMTPSMPKPLVPSSVDKSKQPKIAVRTNETRVASRGRAGQIRSSDSSSTSHVGKFLVLKPGRENGVTTAPKDASTPTSDAIQPSNSIVSALENKAAAISLGGPKSTTVDKRSSQSLARSRSEFFKLMRRKTSLSRAVSSPSAETSGEIIFKEGDTALISRVSENGISDKIESFSDVGENSFDGSVYPDEEEAAFLRSLGWEENGGEDEGLTEEEINAFYQEYMNRMPSMKLSEDTQLKCSLSS